MRVRQSSVRSGGHDQAPQAVGMWTGTCRLVLWVYVGAFGLCIWGYVADMAGARSMHLPI